MQNVDNIDNIYTIIRQLGGGNFSHIYLVKDQNNEECAARIRVNQINGFQQELQMTQRASDLNSKNIVHLKNHGTGTTTIGGNVQNNQNYLILDYYPKRDLSLYINNMGLNEKYAKFIFYKILRGVQELHNSGICHRNLNLNTILLDKNYNPIISNFACATNFVGNNLFGQFGNPEFMPPQMHNNQAYDGFKADIFSLGVILFHLVFGRQGFAQATNNDPLYIFIINRNYDQFWNNLPPELLNMQNSHDFKDLYLKMIDPDEENRPNVEQILNCNFVNEVHNLDKNEQDLLEKEVIHTFIEREYLINQNMP